MTTYIPFTPSALAVPTFQPELDGQEYNCAVTWNLFGQRYYLNLYTLGGTLVFCKALVGSPAGVDLQSLTWNIATTQVMATTVEPHGYTIGATISLTVSGVTPDAFNGQVEAFVTGPSTFTYSLASDPGIVSTLGTASFDINLVAGYSNPDTGVAFSSTMVFRNQQFEIAP
jgi:hypothetical protein